MRQAMESGCAESDGTGLEKMTPVDLILIEGFKTAPHPKIECHRATTERPLICEANDTIVAVASDIGMVMGELGQLDLNDVGQIADFVVSKTGLGG